MNTDPSFLNLFSFQIRLDMPSSLPSSLKSVEEFQYASCPSCHSRFAKVTHRVKEYKTLFRIYCSDCGYDDDDVCDY